jgi:hypothetical protein
MLIVPKAIVRLEGLGKLKKKIHLIGTRTRDLPACGTVPQPNKLPRAPSKMGLIGKYIVSLVVLTHPAAAPD